MSKSKLELQGERGYSVSQLAGHSMLNKQYLGVYTDYISPSGSGGDRTPGISLRCLAIE